MFKFSLKHERCQFDIGRLCYIGSGFWRWKPYYLKMDIGYHHFAWLGGHYFFPVLRKKK